MGCGGATTLARLPLNALNLERACLDATHPFRSPAQAALFLPSQTGEKVIFAAETAA